MTTEREAIRDMLTSHRTMTLATSGHGGVWAASLFFASDEALGLYFVSDRRTRHARHIEANAEVVATVNADAANWSDVRGLQIAGRAQVIEGSDRINGLRHYLGKFADVKALFEAPRGRDEETIASRLRAANLYRLTPGWIRLIDNSKWFGYKFEFDCRAGADVLGGGKRRPLT